MDRCFYSQTMSRRMRRKKSKALCPNTKWGDPGSGRVDQKAGVMDRARQG